MSNDRQRERPAGFHSPDGQGSDGKGSRGMVDEKTRAAHPGETDTTRFGMLEEGAGSDGEGTGGMVRGEDAGGPMPGAGQAASSQGTAGGVASGLQPGGTSPGGGPGTSQGAVGTGGGSNRDEDTGTLGRWSDGELDEKKP